MIAVKNIVDPLSPILRDTIAAAKSFIPLKSMRADFLEDLFLHVEPQSIISGYTVFEQGAFDQQSIYLSAGTIRLEYVSGLVEKISAGDTLLPIANQQPRPCKAVAASDCTILRVDADRLDCTLSWSQMTDYLLSELSLDRSNDGDLEWFETILSSNLFFKVPSMNAEHIFSRLTPMVVKKGEKIINQGDIGDCCYFLKEGEAEVVKVTDDGVQQAVAVILAGRCFGEDALVESKTRNASIVMRTDGLLMRLEKSDFLLLLKEPAVEVVQMAEIDEQDSTSIFIDVRTESEYTLGHLAYSANIPLNILALKKRLLSLEQSYVFYCDSGRRSGAAAYFLGKEGYNVVSLDGGIQAQKLMDRTVSESGYILRDGKLVHSEYVD